jgi:hypothetical protein
MRDQGWKSRRPEFCFDRAPTRSCQSVRSGERQRGLQLGMFSAARDGQGRKFVPIARMEAMASAAGIAATRGAANGGQVRGKSQPEWPRKRLGSRQFRPKRALTSITNDRLTNNRSIIPKMSGRNSPLRAELCLTILVLPQGRAAHDPLAAEKCHENKFAPNFCGLRRAQPHVHASPGYSLR